MLIRKIELENFMSYGNTVVEFPRTGVVLVTGPNGSGKSGLAEAIASSVWGKTLRGSSPWVAGKKGFTKIHAEVGGKEISFHRSAGEGGKVAISFDPSPSAYSTTTKTQAAINSIVGPFDTWRKCCVFSSQDAAHFTLATDAERKRLLEGLLDLDRFDRALDDCRQERKSIKDLYAQLEKKRWQLEAKTQPITKEWNETIVALRGVNSFIDSLLKSSKAQDSEAKRAEIENLSKEVVSLRESLQTLTSDASSLRAEIHKLGVKEEYAKDRIKKVSIDICHACGQKMNEAHAKGIKDEADKGLQQIYASLKKYRAANNRTTKSMDGQQAEIRRITDEIDAARSDLSILEKQETLKKHLSERLSRFDEELKVIRGDLQGTSKAIDTASFDLAIAENTETVLGMKGVRAHILSSALSALEATSNRWLRKIASKDARISIKPYVENKTGGVRDAISLEITGIGNGSGYKSLSGGQRRRIDVALLLGLAELAQASNLQTRGSVFFDEVFDSLDAEGVEAVSGVIEEMSADRLIVVISHSAALVDSLSPSKHLAIVEGGVTIM